MFAIKKSIFLFFSLFLVVFGAKAQISAPNADYSKTILNDTVYIFCGSQGQESASLTATAPMGIDAVFTWELYNPISSAFEPIATNSSQSRLTSTVSDLTDGGYRVTIDDGNTVVTYFAWVLNNWIEVTKAEIPDSTSNCKYFKMNGDYEKADLVVYNPANNQSIQVRSASVKYNILWQKGDEILSGGLNATYYSPFASDSPVPITLRVTDEFGCSGEMDVDYYSKVTDAEFSYDPDKGEAVLEVTFDNMSINYDSAIWFFYKDTYLLSREIEDADGEPVDSVDFILVEDAPVYSYERSGEYRVRLVTVKMNDTGNCRDTFYMPSVISVDTSLIEVPNVFTPNGDGVNDIFVIKSQSLRTMNVKIYNRWGGLVHSWKYSNITSSDYTYEHSVWDGRIGRQMASPGVYYCVITYEGRDWDKEKKRLQPKKDTEYHFFHLFRGKD